MDKKLNAKDVEIFLLENIDFFVSRESLVSELSFKHDSGGAAALLEMQVRRLRDEQSRLMEMLTSFVSTGQDNEDLFLKSKTLTLALIKTKDIDSIIETVESFFQDIIGADTCNLVLVSDQEVQELESVTGIEMNKNSIHMGPFSQEKMSYLFQDEEMLSGVISIFKVKNKFGLLKIGSKDQTKYLGEGDTTFIEYIRDVIASVIELKDV